MEKAQQAKAFQKFKEPAVINMVDGAAKLYGKSMKVSSAVSRSTISYKLSKPKRLYSEPPYLPKRELDYVYYKLQYPNITSKYTFKQVLYHNKQINIQ